jgi:tetratricopeptide (TPR) repeat protein
MGKWSQSGGRRWLIWASAAIVFGVTVLVFQQVRQGALLQWDDDINITGNPHLRELSRENLSWMFTDTAHMRRYVPLVWLGWALDHEWFGLTAESCHLGNLLLHGANAVLVFLLLWLLLQAWRPEPEAGAASRALAAGAGALLWAVHPLRVEVVAWASGRIYCQTTFFALLALLAYLRAVQAVGTRRYGPWLVAAVAAFTASLLSYPLALGFVAVLLVVDWGVLRRFQVGTGLGWMRANRRIWLEKVPFLVVSLLIVSLTLAARFHAQGVWEPPPTLAQFGVAARAMQAFYVWAYYVWKPLLPFDLSPVYTTLVWFKPGDLAFVLSAAGVGGVTGLLVWQRRRFPALLALWLCHLSVLAPLLGLTEHPYYPNDRYSYLEGMVWSAGLAGVIVACRSRAARGAALAGAAGLIAVCAGLSVRQIPVWRDSETLFRYVLQKVGATPYRADISFRLATVLEERGETAEAVALYEDSLRIGLGARTAAKVHGALAKIFDAQNRVDLAAGHYREAIRLNPDAADTQLGFGWLLVRLGRPAEAIPYLTRVTELQPGQPAGHNLLGVVLLQVGQIQEAIREGELAVRLDPTGFDAYNGLATALSAAHRFEEAIACCRTAVGLRPESAEAHEDLGEVLRAAAKIPEAMAELEVAVRLNPNQAFTHDSLGVVYATAGRTDEAIRQFREATRLNPNFAQAFCHWGLTLRASGRPAEAIAPLREALRLDGSLTAARNALAGLPTP